MEFKVKIRKLINDSTALKAVCSVTLDDQYVVHGVKVIKANNSTFMIMPCDTHKDADGNDVYRDIFHPITSDARKAMEEAVLAAYEIAAVGYTTNNTDVSDKA